MKKYYLYSKPLNYARAKTPPNLQPRLTGDLPFFTMFYKMLYTGLLFSLVSFTFVPSCRPQWAPFSSSLDKLRRSKELRVLYKINWPSVSLMKFDDKVVQILSPNYFEYR